MTSRRCDAVVVGSGFGGSLAALAFCRAGLRTVLLERGGWAFRDALDWNPDAVLLRKRYQGESPVEVQLYGRRRSLTERPAEVVGGNSVFYGGASLRLRESDFAHWPIGYADLSPYYDAVEALLDVHGAAGEDPFEPPRKAGYPRACIELSLPARRIRDAARSLGYRPFRIPLAINFTNGDRPVCLRCQTCDGFPCRVEAKNDLATTVLKEAQALGLEIVAEAVAAKVETAGRRATGVTGVGRETRQPFRIEADVVVLAAGALTSPQILMRSGLGGLPGARHVGRRLMRHCNLIVTCLFPFETNPEGVFHKQICLSDFYEDARKRTGRAAGVIQDIYTPAASVLRHHAPAWGRWLVSLTRPYMQNLLCVAEDEPREENRIELTERTDPYGFPIPRVTHDYAPADYDRVSHLAGRAETVLAAAGGGFPYRFRLDTFSHAVGTARFGLSPTESALDPLCRMWGTDNLLVVDGSFMPTSGGVNPSLTIAANALRAAEAVIGGRG